MTVEQLRRHEIAERDNTILNRLRAFTEEERAGHLACGRRHLGWGVFVLRPTT